MILSSYFTCENLILREKMFFPVTQWIIAGGDLNSLILDWKATLITLCSPRFPQMSLYPVQDVKVLASQSCLTLCDPMDSPGSSVHGISQARILEWVAIPSSDNLPTQGSTLGLPHYRQILNLLRFWATSEYCNCWGFWVIYNENQTWPSYK